MLNMKWTKQFNQRDLRRTGFLFAVMTGLFLSSSVMMILGQAWLAALFFLLAMAGGTLAILFMVPRRVRVRYTEPGLRRDFFVGTLLLGCVIILITLAKMSYEGTQISPATHFELLDLYKVIPGPIFEEIIFRLLLISGLSWAVGRFLKRKAPVFVLIMISAISFGFLHEPHTIARTLQTVSSGVVYGVGYIKYGLNSAILLHSGHNFVVTIL